MFARVSYDDTSGRTQKLQLQAGQRVSIGASLSADIVLGNCQGVAGEHAEIFFKHQKCSIKNLTGDPDKLLVNGQPTKQADLSNGDTIDIGGNEMGFELESAEPLESAAAVAAVPVAVAATAVTSANSDNTTATDPTNRLFQSEKFQFERHPNGTVVISADSFIEQIHPIIDEAKSPWTYHLICNHKLSKLKSDSPPEPNYLANVPSKISDSNDLYLVSFEDKNEALAMFSKYGNVNAGLLGISGPNINAVEIAAQFKFIATWFMIPANLKFHTINGSTLLLDKVFSLFEILAMPDPNLNKDILILNDPMIDGIESFIDKIKGASNDPGN